MKGNNRNFSLYHPAGLWVSFSGETCVRRELPSPFGAKQVKYCRMYCLVHTENYLQMLLQKTHGTSVLQPKSINSVLLQKSSP